MLEDSLIFEQTSTKAWLCQTCLLILLENTVGQYDLLFLTPGNVSQLNINICDISTCHNMGCLHIISVTEIPYTCKCIFNIAYIDSVMYSLLKLSTDIQTYNL